jgi:DNA polymerase III delta prime subunit
VSRKKFEGTERYVATEDLTMAVNAAVTLARPLLVKGEPGTGKTQLAEEIAQSLGMPLYRWHIKSTTKAQHGLYEYDAVSRLRDSQLGEAKVHEIGNYIIKGRMWQAFESDKQAVLLIDEIDKADIEFPNDLLLELTAWVLRPRDARDDRCGETAGRDHHQQQRERTAGRVPAPLLFSLYPLPGAGDDDAHRRRALPGPEARAALRGAERVLQVA